MCDVPYGVLLSGGLDSSILSAICHKFYKRRVEDGGRLPKGVRVGVGLGATLAAAEQNARHALTMGERDGQLHVAFHDGEILRARPDSSPTTYRLRETDPAALRVASEIGIGPLTLTRLTRALQQVDASAVTAAELARAYGIETRSARRLITALQRAGMTIGQIQEVAAAVTERYRGAGFILAQAFVPAQEVDDGVVTIEVFEGNLGAVIFQGNEVYRDAVLALAEREPLLVADDREVAELLPVSVRHYMCLVQLQSQP